MQGDVTQVSDFTVYFCVQYCFAEHLFERLIVLLYTQGPFLTGNQGT